MVLDSKISNAKLHFGIAAPEDWCEVRPEWILSLDGVGPVTLDHIRIYLAARGLTLKDDATPEYWQANLSAARVGHTMGDDDDGEDRADVCPFTILVDSQEQHPFTFRGIQQDKTRNYRPLIVPIEWKGLGAGWGDYSIAGHQGRCHIERKSPADAAGTFLGWSDRRERFEQELVNLASIECAAVVIECSLGRLIDFVRESPPRGRKTPGENAKIIYRTIIGWQQDYRVPWFFCDERLLAERTAFRILDRYWRKQTVKSQKSVIKERLNHGYDNEEARAVEPVI